MIINWHIVTLTKFFIHFVSTLLRMISPPMMKTIFQKFSEILKNSKSYPKLMVANALERWRNPILVYTILQKNN